MRQQDGNFADPEENCKFPEHIYLCLPYLAMEWGKGKVQIQQKLDEAQLIAEEASKPFARYKDDEDLDAHFKDIDRWGDPMLGMVRVSNLCFVGCSA